MMDYTFWTTELNKTLHVEESMDMTCRQLIIGGRQAALYFVQGFLKEEVMERLLEMWLELPPLTLCEAGEFAARFVPHADASVVRELTAAVEAVCAGRSLLLIEGLDGALSLDVRNFPARNTEEPDNDRVLRGAHDGFVESLTRNVALIRRRLRNPAVIMEKVRVGKDAGADAVLCYLPDRADGRMVAKLRDTLQSVDVRSVTMGQQSIVECLSHGRWLNPFPRVRYTERPDCAAAHAAEGRVLLLIDNSPAVMILPTCIFDFAQDTNDYCFPPLVGTFLRWVRAFVFVFTLFLTPMWYLFVIHPETVPSWLAFLHLHESYEMPLLAQLLLIELVVDAIKLASLNTPSSLSNAFGIVGTLILGEFAVRAGLFIPEAVLFMAFSAIANFTQPSYELGYAFKLFRILFLVLAAIFGWWGFLGGLITMLLALLTVPNVGGKGYLYPLIPFNGKALLRLLFRLPVHRDNT